MNKDISSTQKQQEDYQKLTEIIAEEAGLSVDLRTSADPVYIIQKEGEFWLNVRNNLQRPLKSRIFILIIAILVFVAALLTIGFPARYP